MAQAKLAYENYRSKEFEEAFINASDRVACQNSLARNACRFLHPLSQKGTEGFFLFVLDHVSAEYTVFLADMFEHIGAFWDYRACVT